MSDSKQVASTTDPEAFAGVVETYQAAVFNLCYRMLGDLHQAEEAAQETFLRAFQSRDRYDRSRPLRTWLLSIAAHHCIDLARRRSLLEFLPFAGRQFAHVDPGPEAALIYKESADEISRMLRALRADERAAVILTYWYDLSQAEVAQVTGSTVDAVRTRLYRARRRLAAAADRATAGRERIADEAPAV